MSPPLNCLYWSIQNHYTPEFTRANFVMTDDDNYPVRAKVWPSPWKSMITQHPFQHGLLHDRIEKVKLSSGKVMKSLARAKGQPRALPVQFQPDLRFVYDDTLLELQKVVRHLQSLSIDNSEQLHILLQLKLQTDLWTVYDDMLVEVQKDS